MGALITLMSLAADAFVQASPSQVFLVTHFPGASVSVCHYYGLLGTIQGPDPLMQVTFCAGMYDALANAIDPNVGCGYYRNGTGNSEDATQASTITSHPINTSCCTAIVPLRLTHRWLYDVNALTSQMSFSSTVQI
jgi:hypothetical protein